ncbi:hypothetical protein D3C86_1550860 [compost metagenome]
MPPTVVVSGGASARTRGEKAAPRAAVPTIVLVLLRKSLRANEVGISFLSSVESLFILVLLINKFAERSTSELYRSVGIECSSDDLKNQSSDCQTAPHVSDSPFSEPFGESEPQAR